MKSVVGPEIEVPVEEMKEGTPEIEQQIEHQTEHQEIERFKSASSRHGWEIVNILGKGNEGIVGKMRRVEKEPKPGALKKPKLEGPNGRTNDREVVMKCTFKGCTKETEIMKLMANCEHPGAEHVVKLLDVLDDCCFTMPYKSKQDLFACIELQRGLRQEDDVRRMCTQLTAAVQALHSIELLHMDIKPENILVVSGQKGELIHFEIFDFGFAKKVGTVLSAKCGSPAYAAPECMLPTAIALTPSIDIWSLGVVILVAVLGEFAWKQAAPNCQRFVHFPRKGTMLLFDRFPRIVQPYLHSMLNTDPGGRKWHTNPLVTNSDDCTVL